MGLSFRKSVRFGPLRVNLSRSGLSLSAGVRGARVSVGLRGTYVTLSKGGFTYRQRLSEARSPRTGEPVQERATVPDEEGPPGFLLSVDLAGLQTRSPDQALAELGDRLTRFDWLPIYAVFAVLIVALAAWAWVWPGGVVAVLAVALTLLAVPVYLWNRDRRTAWLFYDVDDAVLMERFAAACSAGEALAAPRWLWHVWSSRLTDDWKRNAGATHLLRRTRVSCTRGALGRIASNIEPWGIGSGPQRLLFLPDRLLVVEGEKVAGVRYEDLTAEYEATQMIESGSYPDGAEVVGRTWQYVNKSGGPDRRFKNNHELPIMRYGELTLRSSTGVRVVVQTERVEMAASAAKALKVLREMARDRGAPEMVTARTTTVPGPASSAKPLPLIPASLPTPTPQPPNSDPRLALSFVTVLKAIALADRRFSDDERRAIIDAVVSMVKPDVSLRESIIAATRDLRVDAAALQAALAHLRPLEESRRRELMSAAQQIALADGKITPKERERLLEVGAELGVEVSP